MIAMTRGRDLTTCERREVTKQNLVDKLEHVIWQHQSRIDGQAYREMRIILDRLQDIRSEEVQEECRRYTNCWL